MTCMITIVSGAIDEGATLRCFIPLWCERGFEMLIGCRYTVLLMSARLSEALLNFSHPVE